MDLELENGLKEIENMDFTNSARGSNPRSKDDLDLDDLDSASGNMISDQDVQSNMVETSTEAEGDDLDFSLDEDDDIPDFDGTESTKEFDKESGKESDKESGKESGKEADKEADKEAEKKSDAESVKESDKESEEEFPRNRKRRAPAVRRAISLKKIKSSQIFFQKADS